MGGDSDTIGAMTGAIAQAAYEMPKHLAGYCYGLLTPDLRAILNAFENKIGITTEDPFDLDRFVAAQSHDYDAALSEMKSGKKLSHWIWYVFPQLRGLGHSSYSWIYGLSDEEEAKAYLAHPILGSRLREITNVLLTHTDQDAETLMGSLIDAVKFRSSMTLFNVVSPNDVFQKVLDAFFDGQGDATTIAMVNGKS